MKIRLLSSVLLVCTLALQALLAQAFDEKSIPEPTILSVAAAEATANIVVIGSPRLVESDDSLAEIAVVEVASSNDTPLRGVRIDLERGDHMAELYLDAHQVDQFRNELVGFKEYYERGEPCGARNRCVHGVARCRPSQVERQAFCPSFFTSPDGKQGVVISTSRYSFTFPHVEPSILIASIDAAIGELNFRKASEK